MRVTNAFELGWGTATVEFVNDDQRNALHVLNHDLQSREAVERNVRFAKARLQWFKRQLPQGYSQQLMFDDRGQRVSPADRAALRSRLGAVADGVRFFSESAPKG